MRALDRLSLASKSFYGTIAAHTASYQATNVILEQSFDAHEGDQKRLHLERAYKNAGLNGDFESFLEDCKELEESNYFYLRKNFYLGICSAFDEFTFGCVAALSYEQNWRELGIGKRMSFKTSDEEFYSRFINAEGNCYKIKPSLRRRSIFLQQHFENLSTEFLINLDAIFWLRNQLTHNSNKAKENHSKEIFGKTYLTGTEIVLDAELLQNTLKVLREIVKNIHENTPLLDEF